MKMEMENGNGTIHITGTRRSRNSLDFERAWSGSLDRQCHRCGCQLSSQKPKGYKTYNYFVAKWLDWYMAVNTMRVLHADSYCQAKSVSQCYIVLGCA